MPTAVITGATSFMGVALTRALLRSGYDCYAVVRPDSPREALLPIGHPALHVIRRDLRDVADWQAQVPRCDVFYHLGWGGVGAEGRANAAIQAENVALSEACLRAAAALRAKRFIFAGSQSEYGIHDGPITEDTPCDPVIEYARGKLRFLSIARPLAEALGIEYVHLRIFSVYGPNDHPWTLVNQCVQGFLAGERVPLSSCEQMWNFLHVEDAAEAMRLIGECPLSDPNPVYHLAGADTRPLRAFVEAIWEAAGRRGAPGWNERQGAPEKAHGIEPCIRKFTRATGWSPRITFEEGARALVEAARQGGSVL